MFRSMQRTALHLAISALLFASAPATASTAADDATLPQDCRDGSMTCLDRVQVTATRRPESTLDVPAATTVVGREALREAAPQTVMDALHGEVGTFVQQTTPGQGVVIVRGLKGSEVLHLVDGFRLNNAIFRNAPNQYIALVDAQSVDRIEVVRGPSSTLYGGDAMGGVVQLLTPEPSFDGDWEFDGRLRALHATADDSLVARAGFAGGRAGFAVSGGATHQDVNDLRVGGGARLRPTAFTARGGDLKLRAEVAEGHELMLSAQYMEQPRTPRFDALVPGFGQATAENAVFFFEPQRREFAQLRWRIAGDNAWFDSAEFHLGRQRIVDDRRTRDTGASNEDSERNRDTLVGATGQFGKSIGDAHYLSYGFDAYRDEVASAKTRRNVDTGATSVRAPRFPDGSRMDTQAVYVADDWRLGDRVDLNFGARWSRFDVEIPASPSMAGVRLQPDDLTGNIGLGVALSGDWRFVANLGRGFRAPNIFDLGVFGPRPGNRFSIPNPDLAPERVVSLDAGFKFGGERVSYELIAFRSAYRDKITPVLTGAVEANGALIVQNRNATRLDLWGVEAGARWLFDAPRMELYATATYTRGDERLGADEYPADRIPPLFGKLGARWQPRDALTLEGYVLYATAQDRLSPRDMVDPRVNPAGTAGWATANARLGWRVSEAFALGLRAENLADKRYREHGTGLDEPGRNLVLSADFTF